MNVKLCMGGIYDGVMCFQSRFPHCTQRHGCKALYMFVNNDWHAWSIGRFSAQYCNSSSRIAEEVVSMAGFLF